MYATTEGTARYTDRFPEYRDAAFYRTRSATCSVSSLGIGTYLGGDDDATDRAYTDALIAAGEGGINFFDTAINYRTSVRSVPSARRCGTCSATRSWSAPRPDSSRPARSRSS